LRREQERDPRLEQERDPRQEHAGMTLGDDPPRRTFATENLRQEPAH